MRAQLVPAARALVLLSVLCGLLYPLAVTGIAQVAFPEQANGSLLERDGVIVGSALIGQAFADDRYFHTRPSAVGDAATGLSGASHFGPTNDVFLATVAERVEAYRKVNGLDDSVRVPVDAVTASGSGLDPHISVANARLQAPRVAAERGLRRSEVLQLLARNTQPRSLGFLGEEGVNVLELNLDLDRVDR